MAAELAGRAWVERLAKVVLTLRAFALLVTVLAAEQIAEGDETAAMVALLLAAGVGLVPLVAWERIEHAVLRHPTWLAGEVLLSGVILAATGPSGPFFFFTLGTALLAGALYRWAGVAAIGALLVVAYEAALGFWSQAVDIDPTMQEAIGLPILYPLAAAAGAVVRGLIDAGAEAEQELRRTEREVERERERARLARDLHDSLAKSVEGLGLVAASLPRRIERDPCAAATLAAQLAEDARAAAAEARELMCELRSDDVLPLEPALRAEADAVRTRAGLRGATEICPDVGELAPAACREVLMVAREALRNVEQHARAARVDVLLKREGDALVLEITDDGCGVPVATGSGGRFSRVKERPGHFGITGMRERAAVAGGTLVVHPRPEGGTAVIARLPLGASEEVSPA